MEEGDIVLIYLGFDNFASIKLIHGHVHQNRYGAIKHDRLIGAPYGVKVDCPKGWVYPLQPTPELWTLALPHRTQILYTPDISMVVLQLDLKPGSVVVEAGLCVCLCTCARMYRCVCGNMCTCCVSSVYMSVCASQFFVCKHIAPFLYANFCYPPPFLAIDVPL